MQWIRVRSRRWRIDSASTSGAFGPPSLSPDGKTLLADDGDTIYLIAIEGGAVTPITIFGDTMQAYGASWSPDGA